MKLLALDIGDKWIGTATSDELGITCKPYKTVTVDELDSFLEIVIPEENIKTVVIGYPKTLKGEESDQTKKIVKEKERLEQKFTDIKWVLWDERFSSKWAQGVQGRGYQTKENKLREHSIAAAFILKSYLDYKAVNK